MIWLQKKTYEKFGVNEYWLVDLHEQWVEIFLNVNQKFKLHQRLDKEGTLKSKVLNRFEIDMETVFNLE